MGEIMGFSGEDGFVLDPQQARLLGACLESINVGCALVSGEWVASAVGFLMIPARSIAGGGKGVARGKRTPVFDAKTKDPATACAAAVDRLRSAYRSLPVPVAPTPLAG
jgi:hypothetical protein